MSSESERITKCNCFLFCSLPWRFELCYASWRGSIALLEKRDVTRDETKTVNGERASN